MARRILSCKTGASSRTRICLEYLPLNRDQWDVLFLAVAGELCQMRDATPEDFVSAVKGSRLITHMLRRNNVRVPLAISLRPDYCTRARSLVPFYGCSRYISSSMRRGWSNIRRRFCAATWRVPCSATPTCVSVLPQNRFVPYSREPFAPS